MQAKLGEEANLEEVPATQRGPLPLSLAHYERASTHRDAAIVAAQQSGGYTMKAIGEHFGLHYSMVSRIVTAAENSTFKM